MCPLSPSSVPFVNAGTVLDPTQKLSYVEAAWKTEDLEYAKDRM
jgi:hypothetical protein